MTEETPVETSRQLRSITTVVVPPERTVSITTIEEKNEYLIKDSEDHFLLSPTHANLLYNRNLLHDDSVYRVHDAIPGRAESAGVYACVPAERMFAEFRSHPDPADRATVLESLLLELRNIQTNPPMTGSVEGQQPMVDAYATRRLNQLRLAQEFIAMVRAGAPINGVEAQVEHLEAFVTQQLQPVVPHDQVNDEVWLREQMERQKQLWKEAREKKKLQG